MAKQIKFLSIILLSIFYFMVGCRSNNYHMGKCANWDTLAEPVEKYIPDSMKYLIPIFKTIKNNDQHYRCSFDKDYFDENIQKQHILDSANEVKVIEILIKYGYRGVYAFGYTGMRAIASVVQHGSDSLQKGMYPVFVEAFKDSMLDPQIVMMLEDRINTHAKRKQYCGTQISTYYEGKKRCYDIYPLFNVDSVDFYRSKFGIYGETFAHYYERLAHKKWDIEQYKRELPVLMKKYKITDSVSVHYNLPYPNFILEAQKKLGIKYVKTPLPNFKKDK